MPTSEQARRGLQLVTNAAIADVVQVAGAYSSPAAKVTALFRAVPLIVGDYLDGSSALALDYYDDQRDSARPTTDYTSTPFTEVREADIGNAVAWATTDLRDPDVLRLASVDTLSDQMLNRLTPFVQREVAAGFWDTVTGNVNNDEDAVGWARVARSGACPFCRLLADKGAIFRKDTVGFAAHKGCHCGTVPKFRGGIFGPEADVMQYAASSKRRSPADKARLREYLKANYA